MRFLKRLWYLNRNQDIARLVRLLERVMKKRFDVVVAVPLVRRRELMNNDPVLKTALKLYTFLDDFFRTVGCAK
jgi:hypothetical protein